MTSTLRTILQSSTAILALATLGALLTKGHEFGVGVGLSGLLALANLSLWVVVGRGMVSAAAEGRPAGLSALLYVAKLGLLVGGLWLLVSHLPAVAVLLGTSIPVVVMMSVGLYSSLAALRVEEA